ncbi:MAG: hypothetical protein KKD25_05785 [Gammaproteobacteria bacterium]|jgi:hypothetical protein|nr:hypothetical protein [Gammaproteobacteria bacterium]MBU0771555.1 hypothetical protein [Gammaproteobacteria bacterium]MBU0856016.1 hypothetical protein [Gammaproteobacteria bacterium]MBU1846649.1 hypothetical protein [Gammaproteobacteria bacterium]
MLSRATHGLISRLLIVLSLFMQCAGAAYACPVAGGGAAPVMDCDNMAMDHGRMMDSDLPGLCVQHCHPAPFSDQTHPPVLAAPAPAGCYVLAAPLEAPRLAQVDAERVVLTADDPPHAILHCCFRI